jgi:uncharacterized membrane protein
MLAWSSAAPSILASFLASLVEFVEALTIVLAVGVVRGWRSALLGAGAGVVALLVLLLAAGSAIARVPLGELQWIIGLLLLLFGLRWLRKAILRAAGVLALHDEAQAFASEVAAQRGRDSAVHGRLDPIAALTTFKAVVLEGVEVIFIVIALGAGGTLLVPAAAGAALALLCVLALGVWLHRPLARVPENTLKFAVGVMLTAFGTFWVGEGMGLHWPAGDLAILLLIALYLVLAACMVALCRRLRASAAPRPPHAKGTAAGSGSAWRAVLDEGIGLFIDDVPLALGSVAWVLLTGALVARTRLAPLPLALVLVAGIAALLGLSAWRRARGRA